MDIKIYTVKDIIYKYCKATHPDKYSSDKEKYNLYIKSFKHNKELLNEFQTFTDTMNRHPMIDADVYITALADYYKGIFNPKYLNTQNSIKIYKVYIQCINNLTDINKIHVFIKQSINYVINFCKEHNISTFNEYVMYNVPLMPELLRAYACGNITAHFLACIPNFRRLTLNYDQSFVESILGDYLEAEQGYRDTIIRDKELKKITDNFKYIIESNI